MGELYLYESEHKNSENVPGGSTVFHGIPAHSMGLHGPNKEISTKVLEVSITFHNFLLDSIY